MARRNVSVELDELEATPVRGNADRVRLVASGYRQLPLDLNAYIHVERILADVPNGGGVGAQGLCGHVVDIEFLNADSTKVHIEKDMDGSIRMLVNGAEVYAWSKLKGGSSTVRTPSGEAAPAAPRAPRAPRKAATGAAGGGRKTKAQVLRERREAAAALEVVDEDDIE